MILECLLMNQSATQSEYCERWTSNPEELTYKMHKFYEIMTFMVYLTMKFTVKQYRFDYKVSKAYLRNDRVMVSAKSHQFVYHRMDPPLLFIDF